MTLIVDNSGGFAIRCYRNGKRKFTNNLKEEEARIFRQAARHLIKYLTRTYKIGR